MPVSPTAIAAFLFQAGVGPSGSSGAWSPYLVGAGIGVLTWLTFALSDKPLGASSAYADAAGLAGRHVAGSRVGKLAYFRANPPQVSWTFMLVVGVVLGAAGAAWSGAEWTGRWLPAMWVERFGDSIGLRLAVAFAGGALLAFGARVTGGCTSGHGISGTLQLSLASWVSLISFFLGGAGVALLLYG